MSGRLRTFSLIGTSALAVAFNAMIGLVSHWRAGNVKWRCASVFAASGVVGAALGSTIGKALDGQKLLFLFALVMIVIGVVMLRRRGATGNPGVRLGRENAGKLVGFGAGAGLFSGFFGIGGGFLIVPGLVLAPLALHALRSSGRASISVALAGLRHSQDQPGEQRGQQGPLAAGRGIEERAIQLSSAGRRTACSGQYDARDSRV